MQQLNAYLLQTSKLHGRLQWLEQHLEKILMARRRGRPGAHIGRRGQVLDQYCDSVV